MIRSAIVAAVLASGAWLGSPLLPASPLASPAPTAAPAPAPLPTVQAVPVAACGWLWEHATGYPQRFMAEVSAMGIRAVRLAELRGAGR